MNIGERLSAACETRGITQRDVARACDVSTATVNRWFSGDIIPRTDEALTLCRLLNVSLDWLTGDGADEVPDVLATARERAWLEFGRTVGFDSAFRTDGDDADDLALAIVSLRSAFHSAVIAVLERQLSGASGQPGRGESADRSTGPAGKKRRGR